MGSPVLYVRTIEIKIQNILAMKARYQMNVSTAAPARMIKKSTPDVRSHDTTFLYLSYI